MITKKTLTTLEFNKIREMLASCASTDGAKEEALLLEPSCDIDKIKRELALTSDAKKLYETKGMPSFGMVKDIIPACDRADKGAQLTTEELLNVANVLRTSRMLLDYIHVNKLFDTHVDEIFERLFINRKLEEKISRSIISVDMIADEASPELANIRRKMRDTNNRIKETLQKYVNGSSYSKYLQENIVTMRNGRYVIPVKSEYKNELSGLIHDTSSSGATIFIEPMAVIDANNELRMLESKEQHEIDKILFELSSDVSAMSDELCLNYKNIVQLSFIFARAEFSKRLDACEPLISEKRIIRLNKARHPLIDKERVVAIDISIGDGYDTLIITGPNTGGKTVSLKTLGLFSLMAQAGLHIPAALGSELCIFDNVLADIGDDQSIEQSLSTFSAHMVNTVSIVNNLTSHSLVLFDELGVGTDPIEGAGLAIAIIEAVRASGAICAATTHYAELKSYALETDGVLNASCEFDINTLKPTYKLIIGTPGKSNAFAISSKLGLPENIIERAKFYVSADNKKFEDVIEKLEASRFEMDKNRAVAEKMRIEYEQFKADSEKIIKEKLKNAEKELESAKTKAAAMVESAKASSDFILAQLDSVRKQRESENLGKELDRARREIREHLRNNEDKFNPVDEKTIKNYKLPRPLRKGDEVYIVNIDKNGVVVDLPDKSGNVTVRAGIITTKTKLSNLQLIEKDVTVTDRSEKKHSASSYRISVSRDFKPEIDLRGMNGDEAYFAVDKYLDEATVAGIHSVRLIHGKGTGALKNALWKSLKGDKRIASFRIGQYGEGDGGVTVVELK